MFINITQACTACRLEPHPVFDQELSPQAAIIIATARLTPAIGEIIIKRATHHPMKTLFSPHELRRNVHIYGLLEEKKKHITNTPTLYVLGVESAFIQRKIDRIRSDVFATLGTKDNFRAVRRSRKLGIHLSLEYSEQIFQALKSTPTPNLPENYYVDKISKILVTPVKKIFTRADSAAQLSPYSHPVDNYRFSDAYDTLLFIAGKIYDRIVSSPAWNHEFFTHQATQINMHEELANLSTDIHALRTINTHLTSIDTALSHNLHDRQTELDAVWNKLCSRVEALTIICDVLDKAEKELQSLELSEQSIQIHSHIDELVARQTLHDIKIDTAERVSAQVMEANNQLKIYRATLAGSIDALLDYTPKELE